MRLALGAPRRALVVAPHPDDEVIGAWGLIRALRLRGTVVRVVVASDGAASHPGSRAWPRARLVAQRRRETLWALRSLGVHAGCVRFLGLPDGALGGCMGALQAAFGRELGASAPPELVVGPTETDDHADHRAVARALRRAARPGVRRLGYPVWPSPAQTGGRRGRVAPVGGPPAGKRFALRLHRSQGGMIADDPAGFAISPVQAAAFTRPREGFVLLSARS